MKSIIVPVVTAFLWISVVAAGAQDNSGGDAAGLSGGSVVEEVKTDTGSASGDSGTTVEAVKEETSADSGTGSIHKPAQQEKKVSNKNTAVKKETVKIPVEENKTVVQAQSYSGDLLQINEGNFKYKRIPDIKLADTQVAMASDQPVSTSADSGEVQSGQGFLGMSKTASDIIVKGGIILFIFIIFILYKSRMKSPGGRKSSRKVLNSYRK